MIHTNQHKIPTQALLLATAFALVGVSLLPAATAVEATDPHVASFGASPSFINLNRTTTVSMTLASLYGGGNDNYRVTVYTPSGAVLGQQWFNFTAVETKSMILGNASVGFMAAVTEVGSYVLEAQHWNGAAFTFADTSTLLTTDELRITTEFAAASNPYTDEHNCPIAEEFQRGDEIIARGYVRYASTGEILNGSVVTTAVGNVTGTLFEQTKTITYNAKNGFWRAAWFVTWDKPLGTYSFTVNAADGLGNKGVGVSPGVGLFGSLKVIPSILPTSAWTINATSGAPVTVFHPGETATIAARPYYDLHFGHNWDYTKTNRTLAGTVAAPGAGQEYPLGTDRAGVVKASIGTGAFNATSLEFADHVATISLVFDPATGNWSGGWPVPANAGNATYNVRVTATDGASPPNRGSATTAFSTLPRAETMTKIEVVKEIVTETKTEYVNETIEVEKAGGLGPLAFGLAGVGLVVGAGGAYAFARSRMTAGKKDDDWE